MKKILSEEFEILEQLLNKVNDIVSPLSYRDELRSVMDRETRQRLYEKYPKCWLPVRIGNKDVPFLPICNRLGAVTPNMIALSRKLIDRLNGREDVDRGMLEITIKKLDRLQSRYGKENPVSYKTAGKKGNTTKYLKKVKEYLNGLKDVKES